MSVVCLKKKIAAIEIIFDSSTAELFGDTYPRLFKRAHRTDTLAAITKKVNHLREINRYSHIDRSLICCQEVRGPSGKTLLNYDHKITSNKLKTLANHFGSNSYLKYRFSEYKIIVYVNLATSGASFKERFCFNSDLLMQVLDLSPHYSRYPALSNLAKLNAEKDILVVDDAEKLVYNYTNSQVRLIVVGDGLEGPFRESLIKVKKLDPYARFMLTDSDALEREEQFLLNLEANYNRDLITSSPFKFREN